MGSIEVPIDRAYSSALWLSFRIQPFILRALK
jgi:hypothetical protein